MNVANFKMGLSVLGAPSVDSIFIEQEASGPCTYTVQYALAHCASEEENGLSTWTSPLCYCTV